jgi:hypothetical protein
MTARRILAGLALLIAACTTAACAQVVSGTGTVASDVQSGGGGLGTPSPSGSMSTPDETESSSSSSSSMPSTSSSSSSSGGGSDDPSPVCQALDKSAVQSAFGGSEVTFGRSSSSGCQIRAADGRSMIVAVFDYLKLTEYKKADSTDLTVAGNPAVKTATTIIYVARGKDPNAAGLIAAYFAGLRDGGDAIAVKVLEMVVPKFPK